MHAENVGGIDETDVELAPGVNVLHGRNATNRTSFLQALMAAMGSDRVSLKGDADEGRVRLDVDGETYTRTLTRTGDTVAFGGDPYFDDPTLADLFAFLLEDNPARRAVAMGGDLRELIMEPVDTASIQADIDRLEAEKREVEAELDDLDTLKQRLPTLEQRRTDLQDDIEQKRDALTELEAEIDEADADLDETRDSRSDLEATLEELRDVRSTLEEVRFDIETEKESLESLRSEKRETEADLDDVDAVDESRLDEIEAEIAELREQKQSLDSRTSELQNIIRFNEDRLEDAADGGLDLGADGDSAETGAPTDKLLSDESVTCWTCGSDVERDAIEATIDRLKESRSELLSDRRELDDRISALNDERADITDRRDRRDRLERSLEQTTQEIERREDRLADLKERRESLKAEVEQLETEVAELENETYEDILELHREANEVEFEIGRLEDDLASVESEIEEVESELGREEELQSRREEISEELVELRTRIDRIEEEAVEEFNDHMSSVLEILDYENLDRIWLERVETEVREGRRKVSKTEFELHIVRRTRSGTAYEDRVEHLSESEREVTGLVFALAGYLVHDVYEEVPVMLLDSLEAIDSERIARLVDYLREFADYLVVALLPEDAEALDDDYHRVTDI
ncbi:archaea-specific SMC-related protein [Halobaculum sp. P14]|uniref:archaea-specific SMC-related protein n=1 Tax=Halobaculum sp. P14 TaxID=3421638 RepID=UPI003EBD00FB